MSRRLLREVEGFDAAAEDVIARCAPSPFRALIRAAGAWAPPDAIDFVTSELLYNLAVGIGRHRVREARRRHANDLASARVVPLKSIELRDFWAQQEAWFEATYGAPWMGMPDLDGDGSITRARRNLEPNRAEFRAKQFVANDVDGTP